MSKNQSSNHHLIDYTYIHSPPLTTIDLEPPSKRHKTSTSFPQSFVTTDPQPVATSLVIQPQAIPSTPLKPCPSLTSHALSSTCPTAPAPLYSLPDFKVGSLPHQLPSAWPINMINEFLTPPSTRSLSFSDLSSASSLASDYPLVFDMDD